MSQFAEFIETHEDAVLRRCASGDASSSAEQLRGRLRELVSLLRRGPADSPQKSSPAAHELGHQGLPLGRVLLDLAEESGASMSAAEVRTFIDFLASPVSATDVTALVQARKRAEDDAAALRASEEQLRQVVDATGVGTWQLDLRTREVVADAPLRALHGFPPEGVVNFEEAMGVVHPEDQPRLSAAIEAAVDPKGSRAYLVEYRLANGAGQRR